MTAPALCRSCRTRPTPRWTLHRPVHLCRAGDRLARQQQHRRVDLRTDARRTASHPGMGRDERRYRRHDGHDWPLHPLQAPCDATVAWWMWSIPPSSRLPHRKSGLPSAKSHTDRGHRPPARRAFLRAWGIDRMARFRTPPRSRPCWFYPATCAVGRRLDRHQFRRRLPQGGRDAAGGRDRARSSR